MAAIRLDRWAAPELGWVAGILRGCAEDLAWVRTAILLVREVVLVPGWAVAPLGRAAAPEVAAELRA